MRKALDLKQTLNLPQTKFSMKANLPQNEPRWLARWSEEDLYGRIRQTRNDAPLFTLHDGPPYANGRIHLGTALNKILKDFIIKWRTLAGFNAPYVPGWDCHGLPIEINVDKELGAKKRQMSTVEIRRACRRWPTPTTSTPASTPASCATTPRREASSGPKAGSSRSGSAPPTASSRRSSSQTGDGSRATSSSTARAFTSG